MGTSCTWTLQVIAIPHMAALELQTSTSTCLCDILSQILKGASNSIRLEPNGFSHNHSEQPKGWFWWLLFFSRNGVNMRSSTWFWEIQKGSSGYYPPIICLSPSRKIAFVYFPIMERHHYHNEERCFPYAFYDWDSKLCAKQKSKVK